MRHKRWLIGLAVLIVLLVVFRDAPLIRAMGNLAVAIGGLLMRSLAAV